MLHGNVGRQNAKKEKIKKTYIHFRIDSDKKNQWEEYARKDGKDLTKWITAKCDKQSMVNKNQPLTPQLVDGATAVVVNVYADDSLSVVC